MMLETLNRWADRLRGSAFAFPLAVLAAALMIGISEIGYQQAVGRLTELVAMGQTRLQLVRLVRRIADAESGHRGYLLTGRTEYLAPYRTATQDVDDSLAQLQELLVRSNDSGAVPDLRQLDKHVRTKLSEMAEVLALFQNGRGSAARELMLTDIGRDEMVSIQLLTDTMLARQNALVARGLSYVFDTLNLNRVGVAAMTAISLLVLGMYLRQRRQSDLELATRQALVQVERDRLEVEVLHRTSELTDLARHLETAREDERARLARDLHDELGALLTAAKLDVARMRPKLQQSAPELMPRMVHLIEALNSGIALKRRIIEDLRPSSLSNLGLLPALEILCAEFGERMAMQVATRFSPVALNTSSELTVFRLVQESLNNIAKHARADEIIVEVGPKDGYACVSVIDDGIGFDSKAVQLARHGLVGMRYRVQAEGGHLEVQSTPGQGTQVRARLPLTVPEVVVPTA